MRPVAKDNEAAVASAEMERIEGLNDRAADTFEPLAVLARLAGSRWQEQFTKAALFLAATKGRDMQGAGLLLDILTLFVCSGRYRLLSEAIVGSLHGGKDWLPSEFFVGRQLTQSSLAFALRPYGILPITVRDGSKVGRGYKVEDFRQALLHYVPRSDIDERLKEIESGEALRKEARVVAEQEYKAEVARRAKISLEAAEEYVQEHKLDQL